MRNILTTLLFLFIVSICFGQSTNDSIPISLEVGSKNKEFMEFLQFMNIDKHTITIADKTIKNKVIHLRLREFIDGKLTRTEDFLRDPSLSSLYKFSSTDSVFQFRVWAQQFSKDSLKIYFRFKRHSITQKFKTFQIDEYSLRNPNEIQGENPKLPISNFTPFLVYTLPYQDPKNPGQLQYCTLTRDGVRPEQWGNIFKIKHYILIEMKFE
jgi:hypothetical protein